MRNPRLTLMLTDEYGREEALVCWDAQRQEVEIKVERPCEITGSFDELIHQMKSREYRKETFGDIGRRLGNLLAERLEDKEGWHGEDRAEKTNKP